MKRKKFYLAMLCVLLTYSAFATHTSLKEKTDEWLQSSEEVDPVPPYVAETPPDDPEWDGNPIGDAFLPLLGFGFIYAIVVASRSKASPAEGRAV
jgi:hypothetical protein